MILLPFVALSCALLVNASPIGNGDVLEKRAAPTVKITSGTVVGSSSAGIDSFKGIPFAQPPVGNLRLKPPQPITTSLGTINAVGTPKGCPQGPILSPLVLSGLPKDVVTLVEDTPIFQTATDQSEDCLNLNVQRPSNLTPSSKLPVVVWIYGGGFEAGSTSTYDGTSLVQRSVALGAPVLFVEMNYRVGGFGFLAGKELQADGSTNLGLRDQRLALEWVQDNIAAFGGDPTKVTIWGESAGAISVFDQTVINGGDNTYKSGKLFRGAIMDSGSIVPAEPVSGQSAQDIYNTVVQNAGCASSANTLQCLRSLSFGDFFQATTSVPGIFSYRSVDLSYLPRPDPSNNFFSVSPEISVENGKFTKVPVIIGDQQDEGTLFSLTTSNITTTEDLINYLTSYFPANPNAKADVTGLVATYPDDPAAGSPYNTGDLNEIYPQFKRLAAILGDVTFTLTRRVYLSYVAKAVPAWSYLSTYFYGTPILGTFHGSDLLYAFILGQVASTSVPTTSIQSYYISFINDLNPNSLGTPAPLINWPEWSNSSRNLLNFNLLNNSLGTDTFRETSYQYLVSHPGDFRV